MNSPLQQLLVHFDATPAAAARLALARALAQRHGAAVQALYATTPLLLSLPPSPDGGASAAQACLEIDEDRRAQARRVFDAAMRQPGAPAAWDEAPDPQPVRGFAQQALFADLLVLGQHAPDELRAGGLPPDFAASVMLASGRPAIVVPYVGTPPVVGDVVAIAWKPTREAARAVTAALPILRRASRVHVLCWDEMESPTVQGAALNLDTYLLAHGVQASWQRGGPAPERMGEILLSRVSDLGADLLVMGCYGHARAREWILGGVSRTILASMTVPVLMAH